MRSYSIRRILGIILFFSLLSSNIFGETCFELILQHVNGPMRWIIFDSLIYIGSAQVPYTTAESFDFESQRYASKSRSTPRYQRCGKSATTRIIDMGSRLLFFPRKLSATLIRSVTDCMLCLFGESSTRCIR